MDASLQFDEVDFDEPMEMGAEALAVKEEAEPETMAQVKVEVKAEPQDPIPL